MSSVGSIMDSMDYGPSFGDDSLARQWLARHDAFGHFIDGALTDPVAGFESCDPATSQVLARLSQGDADDISAAFEAARRARDDWSIRDGAARARCLLAVAGALRQQLGFLASLEALDAGTPRRQALRELGLAARYLSFYAGWDAARHFDQRSGPVAGVIPGAEAPLLTLVRKLAPVLAAGGAAVVIPPEQAPLSALAFAQICQQVGLPDGLINVVTGGAETVDLLAEARPDMIAASGGTAGRLARTLAGSGVCLAAEPAGPTAFMILPDADLDAAADTVIEHLNSARIFVAESVAARFEARLQTRLARLRIGPAVDDATDIVCVADPRQQQALADLCQQAVKAGAELICGPHEAGHVAPGYLRGMAPANPVADLRIPGPIAKLTTFRTTGEALVLVNNACHTGGVSIWSESVSVTLDLAMQVGTGMVWINGAGWMDPAVCALSDQNGSFTRHADLTGDPRAASSAKTAARTDISAHVAAALKASDWSARPAATRAHALYALAQTFGTNRDMLGDDAQLAVDRAIYYAAQAEACCGTSLPLHPGHLVSSMPEPLGILGITCPETQGLASFFSLVLPAIAMGNRVIVATAGTGLERLFAQAGLPSGVVNIVTSNGPDLGLALAEDDDIAALWHGGDGDLRAIELAACGKLKPVWALAPRDWRAEDAQGRIFLEHAVRRKSIWLPYGALPSGGGAGAY